MRNHGTSLSFPSPYSSFSSSVTLTKMHIIYYISSTRVTYVSVYLTPSSGRTYTLRVTYTKPPAFTQLLSMAVFLNRRAAARYRALASIILGRERPEETTICCKISLVQLTTNLNVILYLSTCHTVYVSVLILFMIMP